MKVLRFPRAVLQNGFKIIRNRVDVHRKGFHYSRFVFPFSSFVVVSLFCSFTMAEPLPKPQPELFTQAFTEFQQVSAGHLHTCAVTLENELYCWGHENAWRLGLADRKSRSSPHKVSLPNVKQVNAGASHTCAVTVSDELYCWGSGNYGQLGLGDEDDRNTPKKVALPNVRQVSAGAYHTCAVTVKKELYLMGVTEAKTVYGRQIKTYNRERTICDIVRNRNNMDVAILNESIKRYLGNKEKNISLLMRYAQELDVQNILRKHVEILL